MKLFTLIGLASIAQASFFSAMRIAEPQNKEYYIGTTPNVVALKEFFLVSKYFFGSQTFW